MTSSERQAEAGRGGWPRARQGHGAALPGGRGGGAGEASGDALAFASSASMSVAQSDGLLRPTYFVPLR